MTVTLHTANIAAFLAADAADRAPADAPDSAALPGPWQMSIAELDSWKDYYRTRAGGASPRLGALTATEEAHRAEVASEVNARHDTRRRSKFNH